MLILILLMCLDRLKMAKKINLSFSVFHVIVWQIKEFIFVIDIIYK